MKVLSCGRLNNGPSKDVHIPIPGPQGYVTLHGQKYLANVILLRWRDYSGLLYLDYLDELNVITESL